jgi:hypothetical protein
VCGMPEKDLSYIRVCPSLSKLGSTGSYKP